MNRIVITLVLVVVILVLTSCRFGQTVEVRPLTIHVIDSLTKEPIQGAIVYYKLEAMRNRNSLGIPLPHENYRDLTMKRVYTDNSGTVLIPKQVFRLKPYEEPRFEYVYINLDLNPSPKEQDIGDFFESLQGHNPISYLKGMIITNHASTFVRDWSIPPDDAVFTTLHNWGTFLKEEEIITVELKRW